METDNSALEIYRVPEARNPRMILGFSDVNNADSISTSVVCILNQQFGAVPLAQIKPEAFYNSVFTRRPFISDPYIRATDGVLKGFSYGSEFFYTKNRSLITFQGREPDRGIEQYCECVIGAAKKFEVGEIYFVGGAFHPFLTHTREPRINCIVSKEALRQKLEPFDLNFKDGRMPATVVDVLIKCAAEQDISMASLVVDTIRYIDEPYVPSAVRMASRLADILSLDIDFSDWMAMARRIKGAMDKRAEEDPSFSEMIQMLEKRYDQCATASKDDDERKFISLMGGIQLEEDTKKPDINELWKPYGE